MVSVGVNQVGRLNLGRHTDSLQYFAVCGLQEGYEPFAVNMARAPVLWMSWKQPQFTSIKPEDHNLQVSVPYRFLFYPVALLICLLKDVVCCSGSVGPRVAHSTG